MNVDRMPFTGSDCLFVHIPKCAGTSLEVALGIADRYPEIGLKPTVTAPDIRRLFGGGLQHLTIKEIEKNFPDVMKREGLFSFSTVRDPVDRFFSHVLWKHHRFSDRIPDESEFIAQFSEHLEALVALAKSFDVFQYPFQGFEYCEGNSSTFPLNDLRRHFLPQCAFLFSNERLALDAVYEINQLQPLEFELKQRGLLRHSIPHRMRGQFSESLRNAIAPSAKEKIREIYAFDALLQNKTREGLRKPGCLSPADVTPSGATRVPRFLPTPKTDQSDKSRVPRLLWLYWHQGWASAPMLVQRCIESWRQKNPKWKIVALSRDTLCTSVSLPAFYSLKDIAITALSDVIRIHLLARHGGVWADATTWCVRPLDEWIDRATSKTGFFAYAKPAPDRPLSTWFLSTQPEHVIIQRWAQLTDNFWATPESKPIDDPKAPSYFWFHGLFQQLIESDPTIAALWQSGTQVSADAPHYLQRAGLTQPTTSEVEFHIRAKLTNVYKLNRRIELPDNLEGTVLGSLFNS
jgi:hypothetical protein